MTEPINGELGFQREKGVKQLETSPFQACFEVYTTAKHEGLDYIFALLRWPQEFFERQRVRGWAIVIPPQAWRCEMGPSP